MFLSFIDSKPSENWIGRDGVYKVKEMTTSHILHCMNIVEEDGEWYNYFLDELCRRSKKFYVTQDDDDDEDEDTCSLKKNGHLGVQDLYQTHDGNKTTVVFDDGSKVSVKRHKEPRDIEKAFGMICARRLLGESVYHTMLKALSLYYEDDIKG